MKSRLPPGPGRRPGIAAVRALGLAGCLLLSAGPSAAGTGPTPLDVQHAAQLRVLAQRTAKLALQQRLGVRKDEAARRLQESAREFERLLSQLQRVEGHEDLGRILGAIRYNWEELKEQLASADPEQLHLLSEQLTLTIQRASRRLEAATRAEGGKAVADAMQAATLSQRMAKLFYLGRLGLPTAREVEVTQQRFHAGLRALSSQPQNSARTTELLALARAQWLLYEQALKEGQSKPRANAGDKFLENVATTSDRITQLMSDVVRADPPAPAPRP